MNIIESLKDERLLRPFLENDSGQLDSWHNWMAALRCLYGIPIPSARHEVIRQCTGRNPLKMPEDGFDSALFLTGRRSGKSRIAACVAAYEAVLAGHHKKLDKGEAGVVPIVCPSKRQGQIVKRYLRGIFDMPVLAGEVTSETRNGFELADGRISIEIMAGDFRTVRGTTALAVVVDEVAFMGLDEDARVRNDTELIRAIRPSLATTGGKLIAISSPYSRKGWTWRTYEKYFGNNKGTTLVWNCGSRVMNPLLKQSVIDQAMADDPAGARSEYGGEFRDDIQEFLPREVIERVVVQDRLEMLPRPGARYHAFFDASGGRGDDAALAIGYLRQRKVLLCKLMSWRPPFNPYDVVGQAAKEAKNWGIKKVWGDNYAAEFVSRAFEGSGVKYERMDKNKNVLYAELLPKICAEEVALLNSRFLINQLAALERRCRSGGRDIIDHPPGPGNHDDLANAVAGLVEIASKKRRRAGPLFDRPAEYERFYA
jgi:hypothetical protein